MSRLRAAIRWDITLQFRNGFYYASAFIALLSALILRLVPPQILAFVMPIVLTANLLTNTFFFIAGIVLLEKGDGNLEGLIVTPLRKEEYLLSKLITLTMLSLFESLVVVGIVMGAAVNYPLLIVGILFLCCFYTLAGFLMVIRYETVNSFILPASFFTILLTLPFINYLGVWVSWFWYLHPFQAIITLIKSAFMPVATWQIGVSVGITAVWLLLLFYASRRAFYQFVILKQGVH